MIKVRKMITTISVCSLILGCTACGKDDPEPNPDPEQKPGELVLTIGELPDSVKVETSREFKFTINRENYTGKYQVKLDTVCPEFEIIVMDNGQAKQIIRKGCEIMIDGKKLTEIDSLPAGEHTVKFANPAVVGNYELSLELIANDGIRKNEKLKLKAYSPEVVFKIYEVDPYIELGLGWNPEKYYENLNNQYSYSPLSEVFVGKRVDKIYTQEEPKSGFPGEWTFPARGTVLYAAQEGGKDFWFNEGIKFNEESYTLVPAWGGIEGSTVALTFQKQGFNALIFWWGKERPGETEYKIVFYDYWGKKFEDKFTIVALDRNAVLPETGHRLPD